ncbi:hypothetical protein [Demequina capsici]|uniref:Uncharacterized protein n=1 Tax=Demequina capsici TaxID=3075620 RepID=A0AA96F8F4_9MICO|nr:hypothetical protein [Demequina sp. OYTSA14]WNM26031.1 hypothetical protein RN606_09085 [Demequina sp. OYTSA14]
MEILEDRVVVKYQAVGDTGVSHALEPRMQSGMRVDVEGTRHHILTGKQAGHGIDGGALVVEVGVEGELHRVRCSGTW